MSDFNPLFITPQWLKEYHTKYPHGLSVMENIIEWVSQTNELINYVNGNPDYVQEVLNTMEADGRLSALINIEKYNQLEDYVDQQDLVIKQYISDHGINVKDFGAVGDYDPVTLTGTDDTASFQAALDSFSDVGGTLFVPEGIYLISSDLIWPTIGTTDTLKTIFIHGVDNIYQAGTLLTQLRGSTAFYYTGSGSLFNLRKGAAVQTYGTVGFKNFACYGNNVVGSKGISAYDVQGSIFENITFKFFDIGMELAGKVYYSTIERVKANYNLNYGASFGEINGTDITKCIFSMNKRGIYLNYSGHAVGVSGTWFEGNTEYGIYSVNTFHVNIDRCYFEGNGIASIFFQGYAGSTQALLNITNTFFNIPVGGLCAVRFYGDVNIRSAGLNLTVLNPEAKVMNRSALPSTAKIYNEAMTFTGTVVDLAFAEYIVKNI